MGMGFAPTWLRQVSRPPPASQNHFNHWDRPCTPCTTLVPKVGDIVPHTRRLRRPCGCAPAGKYRASHAVYGGECRGGLRPSIVGDQCWQIYVDMVERTLTTRAIAYSHSVALRHRCRILLFTYILLELTGSWKPSSWNIYKPEQHA